MLTYLTLTYLFSVCGLLVYFLLVRDNSTPVHRKYFLYLVVTLSLSLPAFCLHFFGVNQHFQGLHAIFEQDNQMLVAAQEIEVCYQKAVSEEDFCSCEDLEQTSIVLYRKSDWYESALAYKSGFIFSVSLISFGVLTLLLLRLLYLLRLVRQSEEEIKWIEGKAYHLLRNSRSDILVASFRLGKPYIIWKTTLDKLSNKEQEAILYHEIAHLNNRDTWEHIAVGVLQAFWFLNPVFYILKRELHLLNEFLADAFAIQKTGDDKAYAALLIRVKEQQQFGLVNMFRSHPLKSRILQITQPVRTTRIYLLSAFVVIVLMLGAGVATTPLLSQQQQAFFEYELVQQEHLKTGKTYFCKTCLYEQAGETCLPE